MLSQGGLSLKPAGLRSRPLSAPSVRKLASTTSARAEGLAVRERPRRPWSASAATRAAAGISAGAGKEDRSERVLTARMRIMEDVKETSLAREPEQRESVVRMPSPCALSIDLANVRPDSARTSGRPTRNSVRPWSARSQFAISERAASLTYGVIRHTSRGTWNGTACESWASGTGRHTAVQAAYRRSFVKCPRMPSMSIGSSSQPMTKNRDGVWGSSRRASKQQEFQGERDGEMITDVIMTPRFDGNRISTRQIPRPYSVF